MSQSIVDLSALTDWYTVQNGETLTGTLGGDYKISITGGTITAKGGSEAAGIGSGNGDDISDGGNVAGCGTITISGGTVDATGGDFTQCILYPSTPM
jgi:hypothetical protein